MAKQTFSIGQVLEAADMNALQQNDYNWTVDTKTDSYVLVAGDAGKRIVMNAATAKTITVDTSVFTAGDVVWIHNINSGTCTVTAGTATVNTAGSLALAQWEGGILYFTSAASAIFFPASGVGAANFSNTATGTYSSGGFNYKYVSFTASGSLTVTKSGLADVFIVGGGGGGGVTNGNGGGGGGAQIYLTDIYLAAGSITVTVGGGGASEALGSRSLLGQYEAIGGGYGAPNDTTHTSGGGGACGGGGCQSGIGGGGAYGTNGGSGGSSPGNWNAGGGGAGFSANGGNSGTQVGGAGGAGTANSITGSSVTYCGGGGGAGFNSTNGTGGAGGGGNGGANGTANTGGGGGGGNFSGGSGIVIVRVKV